MPVHTIAEDQKKAAAHYAAHLVQPGMLCGFGTGSTASLFLTCLAQRMREEGLACVGVATSRATERQALSLNIPLIPLEKTPHLDLAIDGTDEITPTLDLIKGGGGALLREKMIAYTTSSFIVIADESKVVPHLGRFPLPIEVTPFSSETTLRHITACTRSLGYHGPCQLRMRPDFPDSPFMTDNQNFIIDCALEKIDDPAALGQALKAIPGVVEHGLFLGMTQAAIIGTSSGLSIMGTLPLFS